MTTRSRLSHVLTTLAALLPATLTAQTALADGACPGSLTLYGESVGGFCCTGTVNTANQTCSGSVCALDPTRTQGNPLCYEEFSPTCRNMGSLHYYGSYAGGFCCNGALGATKDTCEGSVCALDPSRTQGLPLCTPMTTTCPAGQSRYGEWAGGFCCDGTVGPYASTCNGNVCALDPDRTQGLPLCEGGSEGGEQYFRTAAAGGSSFRFFAPSASIETTANSATITGTITIGGSASEPGITLTDAEITLGLDAQGYVTTAVGHAHVSLPDPGVDGLSFEDLGEVTIGLGLGGALASQYGVEAPMQADRRYLVLDANVGLSGSYRDVSFSAGEGAGVTIVIDPLDPSIYFRGDLSGIPRLSMLGTIGIGASVQGLLAFEPEVTWGVEGYANPIDGHLLLEKEGSVQAGSLPLGLDGQLVVRLPATSAEPTEIGVNGNLSVNASFGAFGFSLPIGQASAGVHLAANESHGWFSGVLSASSSQILPSSLPISMSGQLQAAGLVSSNAASSFLKIHGQASLTGIALLDTTLHFHSQGASVTGRAVLPGFQVGVQGNVASNSASLSGTVAVSIPFYAPKTIEETTTYWVHVTRDAIVCGGTEIIEDGLICGWNLSLEVLSCAQYFLDCGFDADCYPAHCKSPGSCEVGLSCDVPEVSNWSWVDENHYWGKYDGNVTVNINTSGSSTTVGGSISGRFCPAGEDCLPPGGGRVENLGGANAKACASVGSLGLGEVCIDL